MMILGKKKISYEWNVSLVLFEMSVMISVGFIFSKKEIKCLIVLNILVLLKHSGKGWDIKILKLNYLGFHNNTCMSFSMCFLFVFFHLSTLNS